MGTICEDTEKVDKCSKCVLNVEQNALFNTSLVLEVSSAAECMTAAVKCPLIFHNDTAFSASMTLGTYSFDIISSSHKEWAH